MAVQSGFYQPGELFEDWQDAVAWLAEIAKVQPDTMYRALSQHPDRKLGEASRKRISAHFAGKNLDDEVVTLDNLLSGQPARQPTPSSM